METSKGQKRRNQKDLNRRSNEQVNAPQKPTKANTLLPADIGHEREDPSLQAVPPIEETVQPQQADAAPQVTSRRSGRTIKPPVRSDL